MDPQWKTSKYVVYKPWKDTGSAGCVCCTLRDYSSHEIPEDQPSTKSPDAASFWKMSLVGGAFWQIRYPPAVPYSDKSKKQKYCSQYWLMSGTDCQAWMEAGTHVSSSEHLFRRCWSVFWIPSQATWYRNWYPAHPVKGSSQWDSREPHADETVFSSLPFFLSCHPA